MIRACSHGLSVSFLAFCTTLAPGGTEGRECSLIFCVNGGVPPKA